MPISSLSAAQSRLTRTALSACSTREQVALAGRASAAIWAALRVWGAAGRTVMIPANTCYIVLWAVLRAGCRPRLVDVDARTGSITPETLNAALDDPPAVIIPCHLYGLPAPMESLVAWARARDVKVIEDAALALGGMADGRPAGAWGDAAVYSFGAGKILDHGLGGALVCDDPALTHEVERLLRQTPVWDSAMALRAEQWAGLYWTMHQHEGAGPPLASLYPSLYEWYGDLTVHRAPDGHWGGLAAGLKALPEQRERRDRAALHYDSLLRHLPGARTLSRPPGTMLWRYPLLVPPPERDGLLAALWADGQHAVTRWYPSLQPMAAALAPEAPQPPTPAADELAAGIINLPLARGVSRAALQRCWYDV